ncbi:hypothetical protein [Nonomuraea typhae]|uniref:hypothetical protein n=1 Tax=Nonomuraea typhae TaxID=2603600 RepID=UPI0012F8063B|nr:hypothetical protein [Nonomuraea typhae]
MSTKRSRLTEEEVLLSALMGELTCRQLSAVRVTDADGRAALDVLDCGFRPRRVFVELSFHWFYWGDRSDERVSCQQIPYAAARIAEASQAGWYEGEQGDLRSRIDKIVRAYRIQ